MPKLIYLSLSRYPNEKAHSLQISQNCEAFAQIGYNTELWVSARRTTPELRAVNPFEYYGVAPRFAIRRVPVLDLYGILRGKGERLAFYLVIVTYCLMAALRLLFSRADVYYTRDEYVVLLLRLLKPRQRIVYEAHLFSDTRLGARLQRAVVRGAGYTIAITPRLAQDLIQQRGAPAERVMVAHDGIRAERFAQLPAPAQARAQSGWHASDFIVGFVGKLEMIGMDKGVGRLLEACAPLTGVSVALVGGTPAQNAKMQALWRSLGAPDQRLYIVGHVPPAEVAHYLAAFDLCAMPHPFNAQFAHYTSPLKLFEYMAAGRAIVASDMPAWADVVKHGETAYLVPPDDTHALRSAIQTLYSAPELRQRLGEQARQRALAHYTWQARAEGIRRFIEGQGHEAY